MPDSLPGSWTFDQRQRYAFLREAVRTLPLKRPCRLLDVGGAAPDRDGRPGWLPVLSRDFNTQLSTAENDPQTMSGAPAAATFFAVVLDRFVFSAPGYIRGDGRALPFPDGAFDVVSALDVLEHIPGNDRPAFLREMLRVSSGLVLVSGPRRDEAVMAAEKGLADEIEKRYHIRHVQLAEHEEHGLISDAGTRLALESGGAAVVSLGFGSLASWADAQQLRARYLLRKKTTQVLAKLDAYLEAGDLGTEFEAPFYRMFWLASKSVSRDDLESMADTIRGGLSEAWEAAQGDRERRFREFAAAAAAMEAEPFLSALVIARGDTQALGECLRRLLTQNAAFDLEVAVWNRGGAFPSASETAREFPGVRVIDEPELEGAAKRLRGDAVLLVHEKARLPEGAVDGLQDRRRRDPGPGVWAWRLSWKRFFTWSRTGRSWSRFTAGRAPAWKKKEPVLAKPGRGWIFGRCLLVSREALAGRRPPARSRGERSLFLWG